MRNAISASFWFHFRDQLDRVRSMFEEVGPGGTVAPRVDGNVTLISDEQACGVRNRITTIRERGREAAGMRVYDGVLRWYEAKVKVGQEKGVFLPAWHELGDSARERTVEVLQKWEKAQGNKC